MGLRRAWSKVGLLVLMLGGIVVSGCAAPDQANLDADTVSTAHEDPPRPRLKPDLPNETPDSPNETNETGSETSKAPETEIAADRALGGQDLYEPLPGQTTDTILKALGDPSAVIDNPPGEIWHYRQKTCTLKIFLYPEVSTRALQVVTTETAGGNASGSTCRWRTNDVGE